MKVAFDASGERIRQSGIERYSAELRRELAMRDDVEIHTLQSEWVRRKRHQIAWHSVSLPRAFRRTDADLLHLPSYSLVPTGGPVVVTIHDLAFRHHPEWFDAGTILYLNRAMASLCRRTQHWIVVSKDSADDLTDFYGIRSEDITVTPLGVRSDQFASTDNSHVSSRDGPPVVLCVAAMVPRKNLATLLRAFAQVRDEHKEWRLSIVGPDGPERPRLTELLQSLQIGDRAKIETNLSELQLRSRYESAEMLVMPSLHEGFGLPVLEAMSSGLAVATSRAGALAEVGGDAVEYFDAQDVDDLARCMSGLMAEDTRRSKLRRRGTKRAAEFTWAATAEKTVHAYRRALGLDRPERL